jgi:hypothetical protein
MLYAIGDFYEGDIMPFLIRSFSIVKIGENLFFFQSVLALHDRRLEVTSAES